MPCYHGLNTEGKPSKYPLNYSISKLSTVPISRVYMTSVATFLNLHPVPDIFTACLLRVIDITVASRTGGVGGRTATGDTIHGVTPEWN